VYGALPPESRRQQAALFNGSGGSSGGGGGAGAEGLEEQLPGGRVLVASDAVGMGLNLNIRRVVFAAMHKFDGTERRPLKVRQRLLGPPSWLEHCSAVGVLGL
jgi:ATP-dependent RNA helicase SUPV3L1/SUV3